MQHSCTRGDLVSSVEMKEKFGSEYPAYQPDSISVKKLQSLIAGIEITLVLGKWCGDCQREVPRFYKVLDMAGVSETAINLICVDESKNAPDGLIDGLSIKHVPTFILSANNKEIGRITELPLATLENDMVTILENR
jgi:thiol-disulfide isomerase/thioredoxin